MNSMRPTTMMNPKRKIESRKMSQPTTMRMEQRSMRKNRLTKMKKGSKRKRMPTRRKQRLKQLPTQRKEHHNASDDQPSSPFSFRVSSPNLLVPKKDRRAHKEELPIQRVL